MCDQINLIWTCDHVKIAQLIKKMIEYFKDHLFMCVSKHY